VSATYLPSLRKLTVSVNLLYGGTWEFLLSSLHTLSSILTFSVVLQSWNFFFSLSVVRFWELGGGLELKLVRGGSRWWWRVIFASHALNPASSAECRLCYSFAVLLVGDGLLPLYYILLRVRRSYIFPRSITIDVRMWSKT